MLKRSQLKFPQLEILQAGIAILDKLDVHFSNPENLEKI
jgi:restriction endonuclease S subunit